jgi:hypothetical protein
MYPYLEINHGYGRKRRTITLLGGFNLSPTGDAFETQGVLDSSGASEFHDSAGSFGSSISNGSSYLCPTGTPGPTLTPTPTPVYTSTGTPTPTPTATPVPTECDNGNGGGNGNGHDNGNGGSSGGNNGNGETDGQDGNGNSNGNGTNGGGSLGNSGKRGKKQPLKLPGSVIPSSSALKSLLAVMGI